MESFLPTNEYKEFEGRVYQNPQLAIDEGNKFIDNLRENQLKQNQQITQQTQNLGTNVPTNLGGLTGAGSYFTSRYQVPQTNSTVADLRAAAQKVGMQQALENEAAMWKKRYNDAYKAYQKRQNDKANAGGGGGTDLGDILKKLGYDVNPDDPENSNKNTADTFKEKPGTVIPLTETSNKYQDAKTGQWFVLTTPTAMEGYQIVNSGAGQFPVDGKTVTIDGKVFRYDAGTDMWYRQTYMFGQGR